MSLIGLQVTPLRCPCVQGRKEQFLELNRLAQLMVNGGPDPPPDPPVPHPSGCGFQAPGGSADVPPAESTCRRNLPSCLLKNSSHWRQAFHKCLLAYHPRAVADSPLPRPPGPPGPSQWLPFCEQGEECVSPDGICKPPTYKCTCTL